MLCALFQPQPAVSAVPDIVFDQGMDYLHSKHIVHFDLKTANLLVGMRDKMPICKVADFGLSKQKQQTFVTGEWSAMTWVVVFSCCWDSQ